MRVMILDDEAYIVEYLRHLVDWQAFGFSEVLTTSQPLEALQILKRQTIDLVISDIRMPEVSGLELIKMINQYYKNTHTIFLSGYSDFEYAQIGIQNDVEDYLLKPITKENLESALLRFTQNYQHLSSKLDENNMDRFSWLIAHVSFSLIDGTCTSINQNEEFVFFEQIAHSNGIDEQWSGWNNGSSRFGFMSKSEAQINGLKVTSQPFTFQNRDGLRKAFYMFFTKQIFHQYESKKVLSMPELTLLHLDKGSVALFDQGFQQCNEIEKSLFFIECLAFLQTKKIVIDPSVLLLFRHPLCLKEKISDMLTSLYSVNEEKHSIKRVIEIVNKYIDKHLSDNLTLEVVANKVYVHPAYLSKLYKQETGENFSVYLSNKRMGKAAQLLTNSNLMVSDIGKMVGYNTSQYFIKIFKEKYQMTPQQYRRAHIL